MFSVSLFPNLALAFCLVGYNFIFNSILMECWYKISHKAFQPYLKIFTSSSK